ncbi:TLC domain-containing protein [Dichomitus squalens]|uniref:TLC domain-containing protein n=2 Tax=Dichomitus squalens TaxID=114155 RepID=A0A4Q9P036_9APHY|nr:TLC domain-containing protein [Dichomitus squalens]TBU65302.1 TLC domain-containing protein [Dichomitus squalens]
MPLLIPPSDSVSSFAMTLPFHTILQAAAQPIANLFNLPHLPDYFPTLFYAFLAFTAIHLVISPFLSARIFPQSYGKLRSRRAVNQWNIQVVSLFHVFVVLPLAISCFRSETLTADKLYGWDDRVGTTVAVACGYFIWDALDAIINFDDLSFLIHGVFCCTLYMMTFRPFLGYFAPRFLLWETSTIFLNIHRFLDKTGYTGSTAQWINGIILLSTFFSCRIVYGWYLTVQFMEALFSARAQLPNSYLFVFCVGNLALNTLNIIWFYKMIFAVRKRFDKEAKPLTSDSASVRAAAANGSANGPAAPVNVDGATN